MTEPQKRSVAQALVGTFTEKCTETKRYATSDYFKKVPHREY